MGNKKEKNKKTKDYTCLSGYKNQQNWNIESLKDCQVPNMGSANKPTGNSLKFWRIKDVNSQILDPPNWSNSDTKSQQRVEFKQILELEVVELLFPWRKNCTSCLLGLFVKFDSEAHQEAGCLINQTTLQVNPLPHNTVS